MKQSQHLKQELQCSVINCSYLLHKFTVKMYRMESESSVSRIRQILQEIDGNWSD